MSYNPEYDEFYAVAVELITEFGKDATLISITKSGPAHAPVLVPTDVPIKLFDAQYELRFIPTSLIQIGDKTGLISPDVATVPKMGDKLRIDGVEYNFVALYPLNPGGLTVLYEYLIRK